jgi:gliding motility-associated-like protein
VTVNQNPVLPEVSSNAPVCEGDTLRMIVTNHANVQFFWTGTNRFSNNTALIEIPSVNEALHQGSYSVYVKEPIFNCISATRTINMDVLPAPKLNVMATVTANDGEKYPLQASGGSQYSWQPTTHLSQANTSNPIFQTELVDPNRNHFDYVVTAIGKDNKCSAKANVRVIVSPKTKLVINNVITPNGDGDNDEWEIDYIYNIHDYTIDIFDDFGNLIYTQTNDYEKNKWKGHYQQTGKLMPAGTYWYRIRFNNGNDKTITGAITLLSNQ